MNRPKIILDYGNNHEGDIEKAIKAIEIAHEAGIDAIKFQHYDPKEMDKPENYKLSFDEYRMIANKCKALGLEWGISLFNSTWNDVDKFQDLGVGFFKIAACQVVKFVGKERYIQKFWTLLKKLDSCKKNIIISMNPYYVMSNLQRWEFDDISINIDFLVCESVYPCFNPPLQEIADNTGLELGYSCHTPMYHACLAAQMLGAPVIEKHFTLDHEQSDFRDHKHAVDPKELREWMYWVDYYAKGENNWREGFSPLFDNDNKQVCG